MELRDYQVNAIGKIQNHFRRGVRRVLLWLHMGGGKTAIAAEIARKYHNVLWVVHRRELANQARAVCGENVKIVTVQSMRDVKTISDVDLIVWDEAHHARAPEWEKYVVGQYPGVRMLGLSATPERPDGKSLGAVFHKMVSGRARGAEN